ncbi:hypothetical protein KY312_01300, partial [Candidatus Woesearchaeota archaeon]|nr:hypothetical protein [Candidatus Woesearchaeota archaeon]
MVLEESKVDKKIKEVEHQIHDKEEKIHELEQTEHKVEKEIAKEEKAVQHLKNEEEHLKAEINFDFKKIKNIFGNKALIKYAFILLILIPLFFSVYLRMQPAHLPIMDDFALQNILNNIRQQIAGQILQESPNLPPDTLKREVERRLESEVAANQAELQDAVYSLSGNLRERLRNKDGESYLLAIDPYAYYRRTKNLLENGHVGDKLVDGKPYNTHMLAPIGRFEKANLHNYVGALFYKILNPITGKSLMGIFFLVPVIISALAVIPAFFLGRKVGGNFGGFISSLLVAVHSAFITRTVAGFSDTDSYNVTFPLFIAWFVLASLEAKDLKRKIIYSSISAFLVGLFSFAWIGWWFIFDSIIGLFVLYFVYYVLMNFKTIKKNKFKDKNLVGLAVVFVCFVVVSGIFVAIFTNFNSFVQAPLRPLEFITLKAVATETIWPNVYTTVAEQNYAPFPSIVNTMGGKFLFVLALL